MAIPASLLIHAVTLYKIKEKDRWGKAELDTGTELQRVRMEPSSRIVRDKNNAEIQLTATLFYDCRNSRPRNVTFEVDDIISFNGQKHRVQTIEPMYDGKRLHHYEIGLVKYAEDKYPRNV